MRSPADQSSADDATALSLIEFLQVDQRPALILDLRASDSQHASLSFCNAALRHNHTLHRLINGDDLNFVSQRDSDRFHKWAAQEIVPEVKDPADTYSIHSWTWTRTTLRRRWRVLVASSESIGGDSHSQFRASDQTALKLPTTPGRGRFALDDDKRRHWDLIEAVDWSSTELGPMATWSRQRREICDLIMTDSRPVCLFLTPGYYAVYNAAYIPVAGLKHPTMLGRKCEEAWSEAYEHVLVPRFNECISTGQSSPTTVDQFILERNGYQEETYFVWSFNPFYDERGVLQGFMNPVQEVTVLTLNERRTATLLKLGELLASVKSMNLFWHGIIDGLSQSDDNDIPMAVLYSTKSDTEGDGALSTASGSTAFPICQLEGKLGIPDGHPLAVERFDLREAYKLSHTSNLSHRANSSLMSIFYDAMRRGEPTVLDVAEIPTSLLQGIHWRGSGASSKSVVVLPIKPTTGDSTMGFLLLGVNPRTPYDESYQRFVVLLGRSLASSLASIVLLEQERRSGQLAAEQSARTQAQLAEELDEQTQRFKALADVVPCGMARATAAGRCTYVNEKWLDICGFDRSATYDDITILEHVHEDDIAMLEQTWAELTHKGGQEEFSFRIKLPERRQSTAERQMTNTEGTVDRTGSIRWVLGSALAEKDSDGTVNMITWCLTDNTEAKQTAERAIERAQLAERYSKQLSIFHRMVELASVGIFHINPEGRLVEANSTWWSVTGLDVNDPRVFEPDGFLTCLEKSDMPMAEGQWRRLLHQRTPLSLEARIKSPQSTQDRNGPLEHNHREQWILTTAIPDQDADGRLLGITGCITDITTQKRSTQDALERASLSEALLKSRAEADASEQKFAKFAQIAPVGIFSCSPEGEYLYCNDTWYKTLQLDREKTKGETYHSVAAMIGFGGDMDAIDANWKSLVTGKKAATLECRTLRMWTPPDSQAGSGQVHQWVSCSAYPELTEDGSVKGVMGTLSDITHYKWAEEIQKRRMEEAMEAKRNQENFIDMTSHEIRNPLSAMIQCADSTLSSLREVQQSAGDGAVRAAIDNAVDNAEIINSCALHQKNIINDILTLSKLDSKLLGISPVKTQPIKMIREALKMFELECQRADIVLTLHVSDTLKAMNVDWLYLDPSRVLQVLINFLTNAIKFTTPEPVRKIDVFISTASSRPDESYQGVDFVAANLLREDVTEGAEWGNGEPIFLHFSVRDTGRGLDEDEIKRLFGRFQQASPKTHIKYGGSGLGLFISRELTELQGGGIGVSSKRRSGSTFAFYVKTRRASVAPPSLGADLQHAAGNGILEAPIQHADLYILVVEDNIVNQRVMCKQLRQLGCKVFVANHGGEALSFLQTTRFWQDEAAENDSTKNAQTQTQIQTLPRRKQDLSIILMDMEMPVMDGLACTRQIRRLQRAGTVVPHVPIIAVSANARSEQQSQAVAAGVDDTVAKPFRISELMPKIARLCVGGAGGTVGAGGGGASNGAAQS